MSIRRPANLYNLYLTTGLEDQHTLDERRREYMHYARLLERRHDRPSRDPEQWRQALADEEERRLANLPDEDRADEERRLAPEVSAGGSPRDYEWRDESENRSEYDSEYESDEETPVLVSSRNYFDVKRQSWPPDAEGRPAAADFWPWTRAQRLYQYTQVRWGNLTAAERRHWCEQLWLGLRHVVQPLPEHQQAWDAVEWLPLETTGNACHQHSRCGRFFVRWRLQCENQTVTRIGIICAGAVPLVPRAD